VDILKSKQLSPVSIWDGNWIFSATSLSFDISVIAEKLDSSICLVFGEFTYEAWGPWRLGYPVPGIENFFTSILNFRNNC
jgi:hypothetical protein